MRGDFRLTGVVSYLCSQSYQNDLRKAIKSEYANFICRDCDNEVLLLTAIENNIDMAINEPMRDEYSEVY